MRVVPSARRAPLAEGMVSQARQPSCPKYEALPGSRRCRHYVTNGACSLPDEFMCVEWLKANGFTPAPTAPVGASAPPAAAAPTVVNAAALASIQALGVEVCVKTDDLGELWLVPAYTGQDRQELSFEHAALVASLCSTIPNARVTALVRRAARRVQQNQ